MRSNLLENGVAAKLPNAGSFNDYGIFAVNYNKGNETISTLNSNNEVVAFNYNLSLVKGDNTITNVIYNNIKSAKIITINNNCVVSHRVIDENNNVVLFGVYLNDDVIKHTKVEVSTTNAKLSVGDINIQTEISKLIDEYDKEVVDSIQNDIVALEKSINTILTNINLIDSKILGITEGEGINIEDVTNEEGVVVAQKISTNVKLKIDNVEGKEMIQLLDAIDNTKVLAEVDASAFVVDGMLKDATYDETKHTLKLTWNIGDGEDKTLTVNLSDLIDVYVAGDNSITVEGNTISVNVSSDDKYLTVDGTGLHTKDIDKAIKDATDDLNDKKHNHSNKVVLDNITSEKVSNWDDASEKAHTHNNKDVLDNLTQEVIDNKHTHNNKVVLDNITSEKVSNWDDAVSKKHEHSNITTLSGITNNDIINWNKVSGKANASDVYTKEEIDKKGYLTEHQDISHLATKEALAKKASSDELNESLSVVNNLLSLKANTTDVESSLAVKADKSEVETKIDKEDDMLSIETSTNTIINKTKNYYNFSFHNNEIIVEKVTRIGGGDVVDLLEMYCKDSGQKLFTLSLTTSSLICKENGTINLYILEDGKWVLENQITNFGSDYYMLYTNNGGDLTFNIQNKTTNIYNTYQSFDFLNKTKANVSDVDTTTQILEEHTTQNNLHVSETDRTTWNGYVNTLKITVDEITPSNDNSTVKQYKIKQGGVDVKTIDIPKDLVVVSGEVIVATEENEKLIKGDKYLKLILNSSTAQPIYIAVKDLVDVYTADETYIKESNNKFSLDLDKVDVDLMNGTRQVGKVLSNHNTAITNMQRDISGKANASDVYTKEEIDKKGYLTEHQDISHLATKEEVEKKSYVWNISVLPIASHETVQASIVKPIIINYLNGVPVYIYDGINITPAVVNTDNKEWFINSVVVDDNMNAYSFSCQYNVLDISDDTEISLTYSNGSKYRLINNDFLEEKGYLTEHQDISYLATKEEVSVKADQSYIDVKINEINNTIIENEEVIANAMITMKESIGLTDNGNFIVNEQPTTVQKEIEKLDINFEQYKNHVNEFININNVNTEFSVLTEVSTRINYIVYPATQDSNAFDFELPNTLKFNEYHYIIYNSGDTDLTIMFNHLINGGYSGGIVNSLSGESIVISPKFYGEINVAIVHEVAYSDLDFIFIRAIV